MISNRTLSHITQVLPNCSVCSSAGEIIVIDSNSEVLGKLDFERAGITVYKGYTYNKKLVRRLEKASIPVEVKEADMQEAMKILYDN